MFVSPIAASAMCPSATRTVAATATIAHCWATLTNFSYAEPAPACDGIRTEVSSSPSPTAVSKRSVK